MVDLLHFPRFGVKFVKSPMLAFLAGMPEVIRGVFILTLPLGQRTKFSLVESFRQDLWKESMPAPTTAACIKKRVGDLGSSRMEEFKRLTNPIFYKIEMVGKAKRKGTSEGTRSKAGKALIEAR